MVRLLRWAAILGLAIPSRQLPAQSLHPLVERCLVLSDSLRVRSNASRALDVCSRASELLGVPSTQRASSLIKKGDALQALGRSDESLAAKKEAVRMVPEFSPVVANYGVALSEAGQLDSAMHQFRAALKLDAKNGVALSGIGHVLARQGKYSEARPYLEVGMRYPPFDPEARSFLALVLAMNGEMSEATDLALRAAREAPERSSTNRYVALVLSEQGKHSEALPFARKAVLLDDHDQEALIVLAFAAHYAAQFAESVEAFDRALKLNPKILDDDAPGRAVYAGSKARRRVSR